jgi:gamma-glutamyl-gamma-aminobutyrate hydrolase PuuD
MEIYQVTQDYIGSAKDLFRPHEVKLLPKDFSEVDADLIIFSGGADVQPFRYGSNRESDWTSTERDELEFSVLSAIVNNKLKTKKVLGICRGLQLINVGMGGSLIFDIGESYGVTHKPIHDIHWKISSALSQLLPVVNSMHHQGIQYIGEHLPVKVLATEPSTRVIEAIIWGDKFLCFQFHPEFFPEGELKSSVGKLLCAWVNGDDESILGITKKSVKDVYTTTYRAEIFTINGA